jgi:hypothetical protein
MRLLRPGFRHCFCVLRRADRWVVCDPLKGSIVLEILAEYPLEALAAHYLASGRSLLAGTAGSLRPLPLRVRALTCVEVVKRLLGIDAPWVLTPYQLFRFLQEPQRGGCAFAPLPLESGDEKSA